MTALPPVQQLRGERPIRKTPRDFFVRAERWSGSSEPSGPISRLISSSGASDSSALAMKRYSWPSSSENLRCAGRIRALRSRRAHPLHRAHRTLAQRPRQRVCTPGILQSSVFSARLRTGRIKCSNETANSAPPAARSKRNWDTAGARSAFWSGLWQSPSRRPRRRRAGRAPRATINSAFAPAQRSKSRRSQIRNGGKAWLTETRCADALPKILTWDQLRALYDLTGEPLLNLRPSWNIAPTQDAAVTATGETSISLLTMRWGLVPAWAKDTKIGGSLINARLATAAAKPASRAALRSGAALCRPRAIANGSRSRLQREQAQQAALLHHAQARPAAHLGRAVEALAKRPALLHDPHHRRERGHTQSAHTHAGQS